MKPSTAFTIIAILSFPFILWFGGLGAALFSFTFGFSVICGLFAYMSEWTWREVGTEIKIMLTDVLNWCRNKIS
jgi:hypothetical protein